MIILDACLFIEMKCVTPSWVEEFCSKGPDGKYLRTSWPEFFFNIFRIVNVIGIWKNNPDRPCESTSMDTARPRGAILLLTLLSRVRVKGRTHCLFFKQSYRCFLREEQIFFRQLDIAFSQDK